PSFGDSGAQFLTDSVFRLPTLLVAQWHAAAGAPVWVYLFNQVPKGREGRGASHSSELAYVFGEMDSPLAGVAYGVKDREVSAEMGRRWIAFAASGAPDGERLPAWPRYGDESPSYLEFHGGGSSTGRDLRLPYFQLFRGIYLENMTK